MSEQPDFLGRAVEIFVYAPVGFGQMVIESTPPLFERALELGRETVNNQVTSARSTGQVAIAFGIPMLRKKLVAKVGTLLGSNDTVPAHEPEPMTAADPPPAAPPVTTPVTTAVIEPVDGQAADAPAREELPIPGYDALSASQVVERLAGLDATELDAVQAYERAHRQRRTILGKIEQLAG